MSDRDHQVDSALNRPPPGPPGTPRPSQCPNGHELMWLTPRLAVCDRGKDAPMATSFWRHVRPAETWKASRLETPTAPPVRALMGRLTAARRVLDRVGTGVNAEVINQHSDPDLMETLSREAKDES